jgi:hypothetical protein
VNGSAATGSSLHARKRRRYAALVLLFLIPLIWVGLGVWLLAAGLGIRNQVEPVSGWPQTTGWVAGFQTYQPSYAEEPTYRPVIAFRAAGHVIKFTAPTVSVPPAVGASVRVSYDHRNPADAHDLSMGSDGMGQIYLGVGFIALGIMLLALLYWLLLIRRPKSARLDRRPTMDVQESRHARRG